MFLNLDQLGKQLDKEEFQEIGSFDAFRALMTQFQTFNNFRYYFDDFDGTMICKESILERAKHKRQKDGRVNERMMQSKKRKDNSSSVVDANLPMAEVELSAEHNIVANKQQHSEQSESVYDIYLLEKIDRNTTPESTDMSHRGGEIDQNTYKDLSDSIKKTSVQTKDHGDSLIVQLNFTPHYFPKVRESAPAKPHHVNAPSSSKNNQKESYGSNDMSHNYYLEEDKKKTQDQKRNLKPKEMPSAKTHHTPNACTPKPRSNNQTSRNWPASKSCEETLKAMQKADHSRNPSSFLDFKHFVCLTCQKCVFNANHDARITKFLKEVNSRAKIQPNKTRISNKPVDLTIHTKKPDQYPCFMIMASADNTSGPEVILNGDSPAPTRVVEGVLQPVAPTTAEQKLARKNELKARGTLLMALPDKHQLKFNSHKDAKTLMEAIEKRNKADLEEQSLNDLFNSLKIYETEVKHSSSTGTTTQNLAFVSSSNTDSTTELVSAATSVSAVCAKMPVSSLPNFDSLSFDMFKVECYNCHRKRNFARECRSPKDSRRNGAAEPQRRSVPVSNSEDESEIKAPQIVPSFVQSTEQVKSPRLSVQHAETSIPAATLKPTSPKPTNNGKRRNSKACFVCKSLDHLIKDCDYHEKQMVPPTARNHAHRGNHKHYAIMTHKNPQKHILHAAVLTQSKPIYVTVVRLVSTVVPKTSVPRPKQVRPIVTKPKSPVRRHITHSPSPTTSNSPPRVTAVKAAVGNPQHVLKDKGVIDSGCSRYMTGNMSYLSDFEELNGGYVAFGGNLKGCKISGKGKIKTGKLDFDDDYFVKELKFNLFSISQMCDKKNSVVFTDTECLILSPDFKLLDECQVLLRVPRENNMYNVNLKNIVPSGDLTCLFAKETIDESNLWHRRLGYINFKTMNKLVKGNLVRGLPTKVFKNDNTCVACKKDKKHRASCKTKPVSSVDQPLYRLHIDLFRPTFVKILNKKSYCLVVTDDYSRFTWVFLLATKDETSPILKTFITGLENQLSLKVKVIRSDNETEFKNNDLNQFCRMKGIKREFNAKVVNTACYVQNRVLVTKPHNKTPFELLHGRTPSIGFMRPFGCPVTILNILDFLENKPNIAGSGPTWLFDIDSLTKTMNYQPVTAGNKNNPNAGLQDKFNAEKVGREIDQQYVLFPVWSSGFTNPQNNDGDATIVEKDPEFDEKKPESEDNISPSSSAQSRKQDDKTMKEAKGKSPVESFTGYKDLSTEFEYYSEDSINEVKAAGTLVPTVGQISLNITNTFSVVDNTFSTAMVNIRQSTPEFSGLAFDEAVQRAVNALLPDLTAQITNELRQNGAGSNGDQPPTIHT
nr:hypothetical protein [Tanacetum cinerariifolium]